MSTPDDFTCQNTGKSSVRRPVNIKYVKVGVVAVYYLF